MKRIASGVGILAALALVIMLGWPQLRDVVAQAVNSLAVTISATGVDPQLSSTGSDTNINLALAPKGTGALRLTEGTAVGQGAHFEVHQVSQPTLSNLATIIPGSNDLSGRFTMSTLHGGSAVTFVTPWNNAPFCNAVAGTTTAISLPLVTNVVTTGFWVTQAALGSTVTYFCGPGWY